MKEFFEELMYMCSSSNTKSRGLYIFIAAMLVLLAVGGIGSLILLLVNVIVHKTFSMLWLILTVVIFAVLIGIIIWLKKS